MSLDFVAIDFETANNEWGSACAVGLSVIRGGRIADSYYTLMNPRCAFSPQCIRIHGIREADVVDAPTFPEVWGEMLRRIGSLPLVAHNAAFDMGVLERLFSIWGVEPVPVRYACTVRLSRALCPEAPSHRLPDVCATLRLPRFDHHNAADDARACARICLSLARQSGADSLDDLMAAAGVRWKAIPAHPLPEKAQRARPLAPARRAEGPAACGPVFEGMSFVFTGELNAMARGAAEEAVLRRAGTVLGGVSRKVSVLVVGAQDPAVVRGAYSTKHLKALELRRTGYPIEIIDEAAFLLWLRGDGTGARQR
jgi:DNA polymerase-3 subunit epsilon